MTRNGATLVASDATAPRAPAEKPDVKPLELKVGRAALESLFVLFLVGELKCALPLVNVQEVAAMVAVSVLPGATEDILGVIDCHGTPCPVVDIRRLLKSPARAFEPEQHLLIVKLARRLLAVPCDQVERVVSADVVPSPAGLEGGKLIVGLIQEEEGVILVLDSAQLLAGDGTLDESLSRTAAPEGSR